MSHELRINRKMYILLVDKSIDNFTVSEVEKSFKALGLSKGDGKDRQFIYRQLFSLEERGLLQKKGDSYSRKILYNKTPLFLSSTIKPKGGALLLDQKGAEKSLPPLKHFKDELVQTYAQFTLSKDEAKEYKRLATQYPSLTQHIQEHYQQSRTNTFALLAKINVLKTFIQEYAKNDQSYP